MIDWWVSCGNISWPTVVWILLQGHKPFGYPGNIGYKHTSLGYPGIMGYELTLFGYPGNIGYKHKSLGSPKIHVY